MEFSLLNVLYSIHFNVNYIQLCNYYMMSVTLSLICFLGYLLH
uniref:Uncharacterized protein n=1 Tax=Rhizophora mucronata TaxID=61149 RepID=A0A2P2JFD3_RHIMU